MENRNQTQIAKELRRFAAIAHKRESESELDKLMGKFHEWKEGSLEYLDLNQVIHEFHDIINRNIWKTYNFDEDFVVARAVFKGIIKKNELSKEVLKVIKPRLDVLDGIINRKSARRKKL